MQHRDDFIVRIQLKDEDGNVTDETDVVRFKGLLALAHDDGLRSVKTTLLQAPTRDNGQTAIVHARVKTRKGTFAGLGDANPENVDPKIAPHLVRMAETRGLARAFRAALNIGVVCLEELSGKVQLVRGGASDSHGRSPQDSRGLPARSDARPDDDAYDGPPSGHRSARRDPPRHRGRDAHPESAAPNDRRRMSEEQAKLLFRLTLQLDDTAETAEARVCGALGVRSLKDATRAEASAAIDRLKSELAARKSGANGKLNGHGAHADAH